MDFHVPGSVHNNDLHNQLRKTIVPALEIKKKKLKFKKVT